MLKWCTKEDNSNNKEKVKMMVERAKMIRKTKIAIFSEE